MYFPGRDLKPYAQSVDEGKLIAGHIYFSVQFIDSELHIPVLEPLVFLGPDPESLDNRILFQDAESFFAGERYETSTQSDAIFYSQEKGQCNHIFAFEQALNELLSCSLRRASNGEES